MTDSRDKKSDWAIAAVLLAFPLLMAAAAPETKGADRAAPATRYKASKDPTEEDACREHLQKIHDAITAFKTAHQRLPHWLSELSPEYLDAKLLVCPYVNKIADLRSWRYANIRDDVFQDPKELTSYAYEFNDKTMTLWTGAEKTWNQYKHRVMEQMGSVGKDAVPIVRCFAHDPVLNLTYSGQVYSSERDWEDLYPQFKHEDFHPERLFFHEPLKVNAALFPARSTDTEPRLLDLTPYYNAYLNETWLPYPRDCDLKDLRPGSRKFDDVPFDVRGLIQLSGARLLAPYPVLVSGIKVGRTCTQIHFLHTTRPIPVSPPLIADGTKIGSLIVHYQSGAQVEIPILYGRDVKDWWYDPVAPDHDPAKVVWDGENIASTVAHRRIRLFITSWENPWKEQPIESLSLVSAMAETAPLVLAITVE